MSAQAWRRDGFIDGGPNTPLAGKIDRLFRDDKIKFGSAQQWHAPLGGSRDSGSWLWRKGGHRSTGCQAFYKGPARHG
jgi:hypothetical protein